MERLSVCPLIVGCGRGGSTGLDPPSKVELVENAGDPGCSDGKASILVGPSSAIAAGGGDEFNEDVSNILRHG